jgi:uncharacterized protein YecE (DUF72 family)
MNASIQRLAQRNIYFGTSSWKYAGWKGLVYKKDYPSEKAFERECLHEYAANYPIVGVDHTYYAWPMAKTFATYVEQTPDDFRFLLKATERTTVFKFPNLPRYGKDAGQANADFLNVDIFCERFLKPLEAFKERLGPILLEFSQFYPGMLQNGSEFVERLGHFLEEVRKEAGFEFAVEMRNRNWLEEPYFRMLEGNSCGHVFNSWTRMPPLGEQLEKSAGFDLPFYVSRILLQPGTKYEQAVEAYSPYDSIKNAVPELRQSAASIANEAFRNKKRAYLLVNNRAEGCAPITISSIVDILQKTLDD